MAVVGSSGSVIGADIAPEMVEAARFLPELRSHLYLSWSLGDPARLESLFVAALYADRRAVREQAQSRLNS